MKKLYIEPATYMVQIETQQMMALSGDGIDFENESITPESGDAIAPGMSRTHSVWDEDE